MAIRSVTFPAPPEFLRIALLWLGLLGVAEAQIKLDGSLGGPALNLAGPNFQIRADYGRQVGRNLFHSFQQFNLVSGEAAIFSGPAEVRNVVARVTGGSASAIDGLIQSTILGANLYLMNPAGIVFGPNASLDVTGSFSATTADYIRLADGRRFAADPAERPVLTSAAPQAFGFLSPAPQDIVVNDAKLTVAYGSLSLVAGAVQTTPGAELLAPNSVVATVAIGAATAPREFNLPTGILAPQRVIAPGSLVLDGTLGPAPTLAGPIYEIDSGLGRQAGPNLFHSFADFQLNAGEVANFTGPAAIQNILVRVTGPNPSTIGGLLKSEIAGANLFFMNPNGITLSSGASLLLDGSFLATTADYVRFRDGSVFAARPSAGPPAFSAEPVIGVGFLATELAVRGRNAPITLDGHETEETLQPPEFYLALGGEITVDHRNLTAPGGAVALLALNAAGEVALNPTDPHAALRTEQFTELAAVTLRNDTTLDVSGARAGRVTLRGSDILLDNGASVEAKSYDVDSGLAIDVKGTRRVELNNYSSLNAAVFGRARGGDLRIEAPLVTLAGGSALQTDTYGDSTGQGGDILVRAQNVFLSGLGSISASVGGTGRGGEIRLVVQDTLALGTDGMLKPFDEMARHLGAQYPVALGTDGSGAISAISFGGPVGGITLQAGRLLLGFDSRIATETESGSSGGPITIQAGLLRVAGGRVSATSNNDGNAGSITVAAERIVLDRVGNEQFSGIESKTTSHGAASRGGTIELQRGASGRGELRLDNGASISTASVSEGDAGDIRVDLDNLFLGRDTVLSSSASAGKHPGNAGSLLLRASDSVRLTDNAALEVTAQNSRAGNITVRAGRDLRFDHAHLGATSLQDGGSIELKAGHLILLEQSQISASAGFDGGNILLDPPLIVLRGTSITANSAAANAGFITVVAGSFLRSHSTVQATTPNKTAFQGQVEVVAPDSDLNGRLLPLAGVFLHADSRLLENCALHSLGTGSSFITHGRGGLSLSP